MQVLIVDSSLQIIERLEEMLAESADISAIHRAVSYDEASIIFKQYIPGIVILDIYQPGKDSIALLKEIAGANHGTIIIILSTQIDNCMKEEYLSLGVTLLFDKYYDFEKIPTFINSIFGSNLKAEIVKKNQLPCTNP